MQIRGVTSESLEAKIRQLLPSQAGFTEELSAQNLIVPIIDLTDAAEGSEVRADLQSALAFGSQTSTTTTNTSNTIANVPGFYRIFGNFSGNHDDASAQSAKIELTDGSSSKTLLDFGFASTQADATSNNNTFDFTIFLSTGESCVASSDSGILTLFTTVRQIADVNGTLVNPSGFTPQ